MTRDNQEFEEVVEEYEEKILVPEEFLKPPMTDNSNTALAFGEHYVKKALRERHPPLL
jgi:hypothetical protein